MWSNSPAENLNNIQVQESYFHPAEEGIEWHITSKEGIETYAFIYAIPKTNKLNVININIKNRDCDFRKSTYCDLVGEINKTEFDKDSYYVWCGILYDKKKEQRTYQKCDFSNLIFGSQLIKQIEN